MFILIATAPNEISLARSTISFSQDYTDYCFHRLEFVVVADYRKDNFHYCDVKCSRQIGALHTIV